MIYLKNKKENGYTIIELLFYISFFVILSLVVINALLIMTRSFKETSVQAELVQSGTILETMSREIRESFSINSINPNDLILNTKDNNGVNETAEFLLSGSNLQFFQNGILVGNLNTPNIIITDLSFTQINTLQSKAVKVVLTLKSNDDPSSRLVNFYDTIVLRNSY